MVRASSVQQKIDTEEIHRLETEVAAVGEAVGEVWLATAPLSRKSSISGPTWRPRPQPPLMPSTTPAIFWFPWASRQRTMR